MLISAGITAYFLRTEIISFFRPVYFEFNLPFLHYFYLVFFVSLLFIGTYALSGLYSLKNRMGKAEEFLKIIVASSAGIMIIIVYIFLRAELFNSRFLVLGSWFFAIFFVFIARMLIRNLQNHLVRKYDFGVHKTMLIGSDSLATKILNRMKSDPSSGYRIVKHLNNPEIEEVRSAVGNPGIDEVMLADPNYPAHKITQLIDFCHENHVIFKFVPNIYNTLTANFDIDNIDGVPLIELKRTTLDGWGRVIKRFIDTLVSVFALLILSPIFLIVAFAIKWETEGPVFVRLKRVSRSKEFDMLKFRSMINNAHDLNLYLRSLANDRPDAGPLWKMKNDPRVTRVGKFIRRTRVDELPQFWNILRGNISLIGPRPHQPDEIARYQKHHKKLLAIKAGATGLAQISGSSDISFEEEVTLDSYYIDNWSLWLDSKIFLKTIFKIFNDRSAV
ncbi:MAG: hypothetical protein A3J46_00305 [Candidatus Yanofskybacteria bacterium RIFCSPHIGHO2_02_FULL_41_11]|uniref:Bacterial sugar transferase domain-containing protein n=1 Tax=Candidatus Yanofskybacteria bacterium RIFCSPHIGHO2_02_FULL_41_11 TaxID=1802675 RepID=A0A1F8FC28_9BACT|nr:MAG: hypothetical protein A3J46_00305 [Candidatus Yanofskybacteria bacterium RIFCSPHIGHO2_02_FULL_41_11]